MKRFFGTKVEGFIEFGEGESAHMKQVLRMKEGDKIIGCVGCEGGLARRRLKA